MRPIFTAIDLIAAHGDQPNSPLPHLRGSVPEDGRGHGVLVDIEADPEDGGDRRGRHGLVSCAVRTFRGIGQIEMLKRIVARCLDPFIAAFLLVPSLLIRRVRWPIQFLPITRSLFRALGIFPLVRHYYEPLFHPGDLRRSLRLPRSLPGVDLRLDDQVTLLAQFEYQSELENIPAESRDGIHINNRSYESGDAEIWYSMVRHLKPRTIVEIGSGASTRFAAEAIRKNEAELADYGCRHICIEPYEQPWLESLNVEVKRELVEDIPLAFFAELGRGDILFIDSSHMIRPQGDVLFEYLEILPSLRRGVVVHIHDIFTPRDYLDEWVLDSVYFWNEQYMLEAMLAHSSRYEVLLSLNALARDRTAALAAVCPHFARNPAHEPGAFYIRVRGAGDN